MEKEELKGVFDRQAAAYDKQWVRMAPIRDGLYLRAGLLHAWFTRRSSSNAA